MEALDQRPINQTVNQCCRSARILVGSTHLRVVQDWKWFRMSHLFVAFFAVSFLMIDSSHNLIRCSALWSTESCDLPRTSSNPTHQTSDSPPGEPSPLRGRLCGQASSAWGSTGASCRRWWCCVWRGGPLVAAWLSPESRAPRDSGVPAAPELHAGPPYTNARLPALDGISEKIESHSQ